MRRLGTGAAAVVAVLFGLPVILASAAGWPLPTYLPVPADVVLAVEQGNIPSSFVLKALTLVGWVIWAQFVWAILWEVVVNLRRVSRGGVATPAPLVSSKLHTAAARLLASVLAATVVTGTTPGSLALAGPASISTFAPVSIAPSASSPASQALPTNVPVAARWRVAAADSMWSIAQAALGDGSRVGEILELNSFLSSPRSVRAGMVLQLPADAVVPNDRSSTSFGSGGFDAGYVPEAIVTIERGDTLWGLSESRIELTDDHVAQPRETLDYLRLVIEANPDVVEDPNLIFPGEVFVLPAIGEPPVDPDVHHSRPGESSTTDVDSPAPVDTQPTASPDGRMDVPAIPTTAPSVESDNRPATESEVSTSDSESTSLATRLGLSTVLAGGVLVLLRRVSTRRAARGRSRAKALGRLDLVQGTLARQANTTLHEWASSQMFRAAEYVARKGLPGAPVAVELWPAGIEVLWDEPNMTCVEPFHVIDGGWSWQAAFDDEADAVEAPPEVAAPALVTLGRRDGRSLLVDLEAFGAITVTGAAPEAEALVRSIALELASGEQLSNAYVSLVGFDLGLEQHLPRAEARTEAEAFRHLAGLARQNQAVLADSEMRTTFHLRGASPAGREATVVVVRAEGCAVLPSLLNLATPRSGVVVVVLSESAMTDAVIAVAADGSATFEQLGLDFEAAQVAAATTVEIDAVVSAIEDDADEDLDVVADAFELIKPARSMAPADAESEPDPQADDSDVESNVDEELQLDFTGAGDDLTLELDAWPVPDLLVRVLGRPRVDHDAQLSHLETSLVAYLASRGGSVPTEDVIDAVWQGTLIERATMFNRLSKIRTKLGGVVAPIAKTDSTVRLEGVVVTDLQLLENFVNRAKSEPSGEAIQLLRTGLDLVDGPPFDGPRFEWAFTLQLHSAAMALIEDATLELVRLALEVGDTNLARAAVLRGLSSLRLSEPLYRARMRVESAAGNPVGVRQAYDELALLLDDLGDGYEPDDETQRLLTELLPKRLSA
jgi:nucleoid-associated protein YgaU